jgi:hypothetical protein
MAIEQAWGILVSKFVCLQTPLRLCASHSKDWRRRMRNIVLACAILHNMCITAGQVPSDADIEKMSAVLLAGGPAALWAETERKMLARERAAHRASLDRLHVDHDVENTPCHDHLRTALTAWAFKNFELTEDNKLKIRDDVPIL